MHRVCLRAVKRRLYRLLSPSLEFLKSPVSRESRVRICTKCVNFHNGRRASSLPRHNRERTLCCHGSSYGGLTNSYAAQSTTEAEKVSCRGIGRAGRAGVLLTTTPGLVRGLGCP
jgi:hypothetical protein